MARRKNSRGAPVGRPKSPVAGAKASAGRKGGTPMGRPPRPARPGRAPRRQGWMFSRTGRRRAVVAVLGSSVLALAGVAVAGALQSSGGSPTSPSAATTIAPTVVHTTRPATPKPSAKPTAAPAPTTTVKPRPTPSASTHPAAAVHRLHVTPPAAAPCPAAPAARLDRARTMLAHPSAAQGISVVTSGPRAGTLATDDEGSRTVTLYVRDCASETTTQLAVVWMYEVGQFVKVESWSSSTADQWRQLRGGAGLSTTTALHQDVASVFAYWETGSTQWWQSPVAPPSPSQLPKLASFLHIS